MMTSKRNIGLLVGGVVLALAAFLLLRANDGTRPPSRSWSFSGPFGSVDQASAKRGFQIYAESCGNCHAMTYLHYRDLAGLGFSNDEIKAISAAVSVPAGIDSQGALVMKPGTPASRFRSPFVSDDAAREVMNGALPTDLSLIINTYPNGANDLHGLLTGYGDPPPGLQLADGMSYNRYFPGQQIAMPPPLNEGQFTYADGTPSTVAQNATDIVTFLAWAADPEMAQRKRLGFPVVLYFLAMAGVTYALKRKIWANVHP